MDAEWDKLLKESYERKWVFIIFRGLITAEFAECVEFHVMPSGTNTGYLIKYRYGFTPNLIYQFRSLVTEISESEFESMKKESIDFWEAYRKKIMGEPNLEELHRQVQIQVFAAAFHGVMREGIMHKIGLDHIDNAFRMSQRAADEYIRLTKEQK